MGDERSRACLWCGDTSGPLTLEHIVPLWTTEFLEGEGALVHAYTEPQADEPARSWTAMDPAFKAKVVCASCNNGWMSDLEPAAKVELPRMFGGRRTRLSEPRQRLLARWGAKTALMFQAAEGASTRVVPSEIFAEFYAARTLPPHLRVWVGSVRARGVWSTSYAGNMLLGAREVAHFSILVTFDELAIMVMGATNALALRSLDLGPLGNGWRPVAPGRLDYWPPPYVFPAEQFPAMPELLTRLTHAPHPLYLP